MLMLIKLCYRYLGVNNVLLSMFQGLLYLLIVLCDWI